jgi:hypothetical protein
MLGRFSRQLRELPTGLFADDRRDPPPSSDPVLDKTTTTAGAPATPARAESGPQQQQELLALVKVIVERELAGKAGDGGEEALEKLLGLVRSGNIESLGESYAGLIGTVGKPSNDLTKARAMLDRFFGSGR